MKSKFKILAIVLTFFVQFLAFGARDISEYNLSSKNIGLKSYDPVSYFQGSVLKGKAEYGYNYEGVTYFFSSKANQDTFEKNPKKYEPTYGGWCARAMVVGAQVDINPELFTVNGNRLHFFINRSAKRFFDRNLNKNEELADDHWERISKEKPRL